MKKKQFREKVKEMQINKLRQAVIGHTSNFSDTQFVQARDGAVSLGQISFSICLQQLRELKMKK
jgi:hypothetical protein